MKIGIIHTFFDVVGGAEMTSLSLIDGLKKTPHQVTLYTVKAPSIIETENFKIHQIKKNNFPSFWRYQRFKEVQKLFKISSNEDVLIIMSGGLTLTDSNVKNILLYCHSTFSEERSLLDEKPKGIKSLYLKIIQKNISESIKKLQNKNIKLIANSQFTKNEIKQRFNKDSTVIYPPVRISRWEKFYDSTKENKVITISRFSKEKNLNFAVEVMNKTKISYDLIGNAKHEKQFSEYDSLKQKAKNNIKLHLNISSKKIETLLSKSKIYFHASPETFGISVVESIVAGCIPIVPDNSAHKETVPFEELRYKDANDAVKKINEASSGSYENLKSRLFQHTQQFSEESFQNKMMKLIDDIKQA